jgi:SSS family solute:Na+ symporter
MNLTDQQIWLVAFGTLYAVTLFYWARVASLGATAPGDYFTAAGVLAPWIASLVMAGISLSGWFLIGLPDMIARGGFAPSALALSVVPVALLGVLLLKRQWKIARRFGLHSQGQLFTFYFRSPGLALLSAAIGVLFAVAFGGMQLAIVGRMLAQLSGGGIEAVPSTWLLALMLFAYTVVGGMRAVGAIGAIQGVLMAMGICGLAAAALVLAGGFSALNAGLAKAAVGEATAGLFHVSGVIQLVAGAEPGSSSGHSWTAALVFTSALAFAGIQASPMATQLLLSTRKVDALAASQTWVMAGAFGALVSGGLVLVGAFGIVYPSGSTPVLALLTSVGRTSPWFMAGLFMCLVAAAQVVAGLALVSSANSLVNDIYVPLFHEGLDEDSKVLLGRIALGLLLLVSVLMATLAPNSLVQLGALALPISVQLVPALCGLCWIRAISRQAAVSGAVLGIVAVIITDKLGGDVLSALGLHLPWGRWPWTLHSASWGLFFNVLAVLVISAITPERQKVHRAKLVSFFLATYSTQTPKSRALKPAAWSAVLAWLFLAIGPGLVIGQNAFASRGGVWPLGIPPLWAWCLIFWMLGVFLVWFLAYKLELATPPMSDIELADVLPKMPLRGGALQDEKLHRLCWIVAAIGAMITLIAWIFGG